MMNRSLLMIKLHRRLVERVPIQSINNENKRSGSGVIAYLYLLVYLRSSLTGEIWYICKMIIINEIISFSRDQSSSSQALFTGGYWNWPGGRDRLISK